MDDSEPESNRISGDVAVKEPIPLTRHIADQPTKDLDPIDLRGKRICVFGLPGSGKTVLTKWMALNYRTIVFDIHREYRPDIYDRWCPESRVSGPELQMEAEIALEKIVFNPVNDFELLVIDEAAQYFPNGKPLPPMMQKLNAFNRHMGLAFCCVAHRPTQLNTNLIELSQIVIFFQLSGKNDLRYINDLYRGMGDEVFSLGEHEFILYRPGDRFYRCAPIQVA